MILFVFNILRNNFMSHPLYNLETVRKIEDQIKRLDDLKKEQKNTFTGEDVRFTFYGQLQTAIIHAYLAYLCLEISDYFESTGSSLVNIFYHEQNIFQSIKRLSDHTLSNNFKNLIYLNWLNNIWIVFESKIRVIFNHCIFQDDLNFVKDKKKEELLLFFRDSFKNKGHVNLPIIWNFFMMYKDYDEKFIDEDKEILEFISFCRNSMHNNGVVFKDKIHKSRLGNYNCVKDKHISCINAEEIIKFSNELIAIFVRVSNTTNKKEVIKDPFQVSIKT